MGPVLPDCIIPRVPNLPLGLRPFLIGGGRLESAETGFRLTLPPTPSGYADAQVDDYQGLPRHRFPWRPPLRLSLEARASHSAPLGTLGFGFWNDPFAFGLGGAARRLPAAPRALWFFYGSPPNQLAFSQGATGQGWLAASLDSPSLPAALLLPLAAGAFALSRLPLGGRLAVGAIRRATTAREAPLSAGLDRWHRYALEWGETEARFSVDGAPVLRVHTPPKAPLGFVAWIDNQFAALSPEQGIQFGVLPTAETQWLELREFSIGA
jgi:hypothetical protein